MIQGTYIWNLSNGLVAHPLFLFALIPNYYLSTLSGYKYFYLSALKIHFFMKGKFYEIGI